MFQKLLEEKKPTRTFKVVNAVNKDGCPTKFKSGRYTGNPKSAAKKAFTRLCNLKNIKGKCTFYITVQETTRGSGKIVMDVDEEKNKKGRVVKKERTFMVDRVKLDQPLVMMAGTDSEFTRLYDTNAKFVERVPECKVKRTRTRGVMKKTSRRTKGKKVQKKKKSLKNNLNSNLANNNNYRNNNSNNSNNNKNKQNGGKRSKRRSRK